MLNPKSALLIIDVQKGFDDPVWGRRNNPEAENRAAEVLGAWRDAGLAVFHARHLSSEPDSPLAPDSPGSEIKEEVFPEVGEPVIEKRVNSCFIGTDLEERLRQGKIEALTMLGLTTDHCVSTTARMASNLGFKTSVVADACATFDRVGADGTTYTAEQVHKVSLASLLDEFATIVDSEEILASLRRAITGP